MKALLLVSVFLLSLSSQAAQSLSTKIQSPYGSIRALGMGDAFTAVADDYSLIMYNPAGFARKKHNEIQVTLLGAGVSPDTLSVTKDITDASNTQGTDSQKAQAVSNVLEKYYGKSLGGKAQALELFWVRKGWGLALLPMDLTVDVVIDRQLGPAVDLNVKGDTTAAIGFGKDITKTIDVGLTAKYVHRVSVEEIVPALELATNPNVLSSKRFREGTAFDFDLGFMWTPIWGGHQVKKVETEEPAVKSEAIPEAAPAVEAPAPESEKATAPKAENKDEKKPDAPASPDKNAPAPSADADVKKATTDSSKTQNNSDPNAIKEETRPDVQQPTEPRDPQSEGDATTVNVDESKDSKADTKTTDDVKKDKTPAPATDADIQNAEAAPADQAPAEKSTDVKKAEDKSADKPAEVNAESADKKEVKADEKAEVKDTEKPKTEETDKKETVVETDEPETSPLTLGLVVHNVLGGNFTLSKMVNKDATDVPTQMYRVVDIGSQYRLYAGEDLTIRYMLDFKDLLHPEINFNKSFHTGLEFDYSPSTWFKTQFRVGVNQMYYTAGASFLFGIFNIDVATYGEEVGTNSTRVENRVYAAKVGMNF